MSDTSTDGDDVTGWTTPSHAPLVSEVVLHLAEDIHRTWERTDEEAPPFWAFAWAGGQALARHVLDDPGVVAGRRVLDLAPGIGDVAGEDGREHLTRIVENSFEY